MVGYLVRPSLGIDVWPRNVRSSTRKATDKNAQLDSALMVLPSLRYVASTWNIAALAGGCAGPASHTIKDANGDLFEAISVMSRTSLSYCCGIDELNLGDGTRQCRGKLCGRAQYRTDSRSAYR